LFTEKTLLMTYYKL